MKKVIAFLCLCMFVMFSFGCNEDGQPDIKDQYVKMTNAEVEEFIAKSFEFNNLHENYLLNNNGLKVNVAIKKDVDGVTKATSNAEFIGRHKDDDFSKPYLFSLNWTTNDGGNMIVENYFDGEYVYQKVDENGYITKEKQSLDWTPADKEDLNDIFEELCYEPWAEFSFLWGNETLSYWLNSGEDVSFYKWTSENKIRVEYTDIDDLGDSKETVKYTLDYLYNADYEMIGLTVKIVYEEKEFAFNENRYITTKTEFNLSALPSNSNVIFPSDLDTYNNIN